MIITCDFFNAACFPYLPRRAEGQPSLAKGLDCTKLVAETTTTKHGPKLNFVWMSAKCVEMKLQKFFICNSYTNDESGNKKKFNTGRI